MSIPISLLSPMNDETTVGHGLSFLLTNGLASADGTEEKGPSSPQEQSAAAEQEGSGPRPLGDGDWVLPLDNTIAIKHEHSPTVGASQLIQDVRAGNLSLLAADADTADNPHSLFAPEEEDGVNSTIGLSRIVSSDPPLNDLPLNGNHKHILHFIRKEDNKEVCVIIEKGTVKEVIEAPR